MKVDCPFVTCTRPDVSTRIEDEHQSPSSYRYAISCKDLPAGSVVSIEKPFSTVLFRSHAHRFCSSCCLQFSIVDSSKHGRQTDRRGRRCLGGCEYTFYCSKECQLNDFSIHKYTCKRYQKVIKDAVRLYTQIQRANEEFPWEDFMLTRKVYIRLCLDSGVDFKNVHSVTDIDMPEDIQSLVETSRSSDNNVHDNQSVLAMAVASSFPLEPNGAVEFFERLLHKFKCNNFGIMDPLQFVIGHGVYPRGAILNHSCCPNCILIYEGNEQVIRTIQPVKDGEELYHSYTDVCEPTSIRQEHLQMIYGFQCDCDRCKAIGRWKAVEDALAEDFGLSSEDQIYVQQCIQSAQEFSTDDDADHDDDMEDLNRQYHSLCQALDILRIKLGKYHLERYKTECLALSTALMMGVEDTISHAEHVVNFLRFVYSEYHPLLLLQQMTLAELLYVHGRLSVAEKQLEQLVETCKVTFGANHGFVHRYQALLNDIHVQK